ncbi:hypothetical protein ACFLTM_02380 [Candidatus Bipolaricaulota bacterium]
MKLGLLVVILLLWAACGAASPHVAFHDLPEAILGGVPGLTSVAVELAPDGWRASITRSLTPRFDVVASVSPIRLFALEGRVLVVKDLLPLNVAVGLSLERISLDSTLFLGPVHVSYGRTWEETSVRRGVVQHAFHQAMTILIGLEERGGSLGVILGLRIHTGQTRLWGASARVTQDGFRLTIGGTL